MPIYGKFNEGDPPTNLDLFWKTIMKAMKKTINVFSSAEIIVFENLHVFFGNCYTNRSAAQMQMSDVSTVFVIGPIYIANNKLLRNNSTVCTIGL